MLTYAPVTIDEARWISLYRSGCWDLNPGFPAYVFCVPGDPDPPWHLLPPRAPEIGELSAAGAPEEDGVYPRLCPHTPNPKAVCTCGRR